MQARQPTHILLADFDIAHEDANQTLATSAAAGTPAYMSPESLQGARPGEKHDIWCAPPLGDLRLAGRLG